MSFILFVLSWFLPYALYRMDEQRAEKIRNAHLRLGRIEKNPNARKRSTEAKRWAAIKSAAVMGMIEFPFLFLLDEFKRDGFIGGVGVATGAFIVGLICMPGFEKSTKRTLDRKATDAAIAEGRAPDTWEFFEKNENYLQPEPKLQVGDQHGSAGVESAAQSGLIDHNAMAPVKKGGR